MCGGWIATEAVSSPVENETNLHSTSTLSSVVMQNVASGLVTFEQKQTTSSVPVDVVANTDAKLVAKFDVCF